MAPQRTPWRPPPGRGNSAGSPRKSRRIAAVRALLDAPAVLPFRPHQIDPNRVLHRFVLLRPLALALALAAPAALHAASLRLGGFVDPGSAMRPELPFVGVSYASHIDERADASLVHRPFQLTDGLNAPGLRVSSCERAGQGAALFGDAPCAGLALGLTRGSGLPRIMTPPSSLPAPTLLPRSTELTLKAGRISEDAVLLRPGEDFVVLAKLRHGLGADHTVSASALRVGKAHLVAAGSDWRLGAFGVLSGGVGLLDRGNGTQSRTVLGHDFRYGSLSTGLRWGRTNEPEPGQSAFALSGAAWRALPEDGDVLSATASLQLNRRAQLVLTGREHEAWDGWRSRLVSLGSSFRPNEENHIGLTVQHTLEPDPEQRLLLTWQMSLDQ